MAQGFYLIEMHANSKEKTAFYHPQGFTPVPYHAFWSMQCPRNLWTIDGGSSEWYAVWTLSFVYRLCYCKQTAKQHLYKDVVLCRESNAGGEKGEEKGWQQKPEVVELYINLIC